MPKGKIGAAAKAIAEDVAKGMEDVTTATRRLAEDGANSIERSVEAHRVNDQGVRDKLHEAAAGRPPEVADGNASGPSAPRENSGNDLGLSREQYVARATGGQVARGPDGQDIKITMPNVGSSGIDVIGPNGEYIFVGGPAKAKNPADFGKKLRISKYAADEAGVAAIYYLDETTPASAIAQAKRIFGENNVKIFKLGDS
jgi:hypothetical protein